MRSGQSPTKWILAGAIFLAAAKTNRDDSIIAPFQLSYKVFEFAVIRDHYLSAFYIY